jgi:hypothetical protein
MPSQPLCVPQSVFLGLPGEHAAIGARSSAGYRNNRVHALGKEFEPEV